MTIPRTRESLIAYYKRQYKRHLKDLKFMIDSELEGIDDDIFEPGTGIQTESMNALRAAERLKALIELGGD